MNLTPETKCARRNAFERVRRWVLPRRTNRTLVIIDMQNPFLHRPEEKNLIPVICRLIQHAKQQKWAIILVQYSGQGNTIKAINKIMKDYPHQAIVIKHRNNGGKEIIECINKKKTWSLNLLVCGVYGPQCVSATVGGLFDYSDSVKVDVITDAVSPLYCPSYEEDEHGQQLEREITTEEIWTTAK